MRNKDEAKNRAKYRGIFPAFYACYDAEGRISPQGVERLTEHLIKKGIRGVYVGGSSGECIYQSVEERKLVLEHVMKASAGRLTVIAHVACNNTADSCELAAHAESLGADAIAAIPPIYFHLPEHAIARYWNDISKAAPDTDFIIYNIPQLAGVALTLPLLKEMLKNPRVIGVKNSSMPAQDIQMFKAEGGDDFIVFNGPDEQLLSGLAMGADGGIGGTYAVMPELYLKIGELYDMRRMDEAREVQYAADSIIYEMCGCHGSLYAVMKKIMKLRDNLELGSVRRPMPELVEADMPAVLKCAEMIDAAVKRF